MNYSDQWRSIFPITTATSSPSLIPSPSLHGPLLFLPSRHPLPLLPPRPLQTPLPSQSNNLLSSLPLRSAPNSSLLLFPTSSNFHSIAFLLLSFAPDRKVNILQRGLRTDVFKHPFHRILTMSVVPADDDVAVLEEGVTVEGFLVAASLYAVSWFRVESRGEKVGLAAAGRRGFRSAVVDAKLSEGFLGESVVLLESGELWWFDLEGKSSRKIAVGVGGGCGWLGCEYGRQPWVVVVGCESAVLVVDLREKEGRETGVLFEIEERKGDRILAFCKSGFDSFVVGVVTEREVLVVDVRQPLVPVLRWEHGLDSPCYVSMLRLSELRPPCEKFGWASDMGSVILVGSFWKDEFSMFCYGPREGGRVGDSSTLFAWELPLSFALSGRQCGSFDSLLKEVGVRCIEGRQRNDVVVGFWIVPQDLLRVKSEFGGFGLIRLMLSGKLEMQIYNASWDLVSKSSNEGEECPKLENSVNFSMGQEGKVSSHNYYLNIRHLREYMNGTLPSVFAVHKPQLDNYNRKFSSNHLTELANIKQKCSTCPILTNISDATVPTNIFEITLRRVLNGLELDLLPIAFSKYALLFENHRRTSISLLEVPRCLSHHRVVPFLVCNPLRKIEKLVRKAVRWETIVAPVYPIPVILILQWLQNQKISFHLNEEPDDDLLTLQCRTTLDNIYPAVSLADSGNFTEQGSQGPESENNFFVHKVDVNMSNCKVKEELPWKGSPSMESEDTFEDEKFNTFICGIADKKSNSNSCKDQVGLEMFDQLNPFMLDFDSPAIVFQPKEQKMYDCLMQQNSRWQGNYKPFENFCTSSNIPKSSC